MHGDGIDRPVKKSLTKDLWNLLIQFLMRRKKNAFIKGFATGLLECKIFIKLVNISNSRNSLMYLRLCGEGGFLGNGSMLIKILFI